MGRLALALAGIGVLAAVYFARGDGEPSHRAATARAEEAPAPARPPAVEAPAPPPQPEDPEPAFFSVRVVDAATGTPLEGAAVEHDDGRLLARTGPDGIARSETGEDPLLVFVRLRGYRVASPWVLPRGETAVELERSDVVLGGRVVQNGAPVEGAAVRAWDVDEDADVCGTLRTGPDGRFAIFGPPLHRALLVAAATPGLSPVQVRLVLHESKDDLELAVGAGGVLEGTVTRRGAPLAGVEVLLVRDEDWVPEPWDQPDAFLTATAFTDAAGRYRIAGIAPGTAVQPVARVSEAYAWRGEPATFSRDFEVLMRDIALPEPASLRVRAFDGEGRAIAEFDAHLGGGREMTDPDPVVEPDGILLFADLAPGRWSLRARIGATTLGAEEFDLSPGESRVVDVRPSREVSLEGVVVSADGSPVPFARVRCGMRSAEADEEGRFSLPGVEEREHTLLVETGATPKAIAAGHSHSIVEVDGVAAGAGPVRVVLPAPTTLEGSIVGIPDGKHVRCGLLSPSLSSWRDADLDEAGRFRIPVNRQEPLTLVFEFDMRPLVVVDVGVLAPGEVRQMGELTLDDLRTIEGRLVDPSGSPVRDARVAIGEIWSGEGHRTRTDANGRFRLEELPRRPAFHLRVDAQGHAPHYFRQETQASEHALSPSGRIRVAAGEDVRVEAMRQGFSPDVCFLHYGTGPFEITVQPGRYRVGEREVDVAAGETVEIG